MDDRGQDSYQRRRLGTGYINPYFSLFQTALIIAYIFTNQRDIIGMSSPKPFSSYLSPNISDLIAWAFGALLILLLARATVYATSTIWGRVYRNRTSLPPILGMASMMNSIRIHNTDFAIFNQMSATLDPTFFLSFVFVSFALWGLLYHVIFESAQQDYFDTRFRICFDGESIYPYDERHLFEFC